MSKLRAQVIDHEAGLTAVESDWWALWRRSGASPFQSPAWLIPWWKTFRPGALRALALYRAARLVGFAPLYLEDGGTSSRLMPLGIAFSDYLDFLVDPESTGASDALLQATEVLGRWQVMSLEELRPGANALTLSTPSNWENRTEPQSACPVLGLPGKASSLTDYIPPGKRRKLRMAHHRAIRRGGFSLERVSPGDGPLFTEALFRLHGARWASRGQAGLLAMEGVRVFQRAAATALLASGLARFYLMRLSGQVVGAYYGFSDGVRSYAYLGGFDPQFGFESPGTILIGHAIEMAAKEGCGEFDFLRGQERYKYDWGAADRWTTRRTLTRTV